MTYIIMKDNEILFSGRCMSELTKSIINTRRSLRFMAGGSSMSPFIKDKDIVTISPCAPSLIGFGMAVAFVNNKTKKPVIHRIIGRRKNRYLLKGDNAFMSDGMVSLEDIIGIAVKIERGQKDISFGLGPEQFIIA